MPVCLSTQKAKYNYNVHSRTGVFIRFESIRIDSRRCLIKSIHSVRIDSEVLR